MKIKKSDLVVWSYPFHCQVALAVRPLHHNYYSCSLTTTEARVLSDVVLACSARVERKCSGCYDGLLWRPTCKSVVDLASGGTITVESYATSIGLTIFRRRSYSVAVDLTDALELACQLWIESQQIPKAA